MKIKFKAVAGKAKKHRINYNEVIELSGKDLEIFDGLKDNERFSEYFDTNYNFSDKVTGGYLTFEYNKEKQLLYTVTEYDILRGKKLTKKDIQELQKETTGQWSDGIGEGFEQEPCIDDSEFEYFVEPYNRNCNIEVTIDKGFVQRNPIHKFRFYVNNVESDIFEYNENDYSNYEKLIDNMEQDRVEWVFNNIESGYTKIND